MRRISEAGAADPARRCPVRASACRASLVGRVESLGWILPIDDTHFRIYVAGRVREKGELRRMRSRLDGKLWEELDGGGAPRSFPATTRRRPARARSRCHSEEHLGDSDRGIVMLRQFLRQQLELVAQGQRPRGRELSTSKRRR